MKENKTAHPIEVGPQTDLPSIPFWLGRAPRIDLMPFAVLCALWREGYHLKNHEIVIDLITNDICNLLEIHENTFQLAVLRLRTEGLIEIEQLNDYTHRPMVVRLVIPEQK